MAEQIGSDENQARALVALGIAELRAAYERSLTLGQDILTDWENMTAYGLLGLREIGDRLSRNFDVNIRAIFDLAEQHSQAQSPSEIYELQQRFLEDQSERLAHQMKDIETLVNTQMRTFRDEIGREPRG